MPICAILTCKSDSDEVEGNPSDLKFHRFPKNEELKAKWVYMTGRDLVPDESSYICSRHFRDNDYIVKRSGSRHLKVTAIPCEYVVYQNLYFDEEPSTAAAANEDREATPLHSPVPTPTPTPEAEEEQEVVTTSNYDDFQVNDLNDNTIGWEQFETVRLFGQREPEQIAKRQASPAAGPTKRKKAKSKKHRKMRERQVTPEFMQPPSEESQEYNVPAEEYNPAPAEDSPTLAEDIPAPAEDNLAPVAGPKKRKRGKKSRSKKHRKTRESLVTPEYVQPIEPIDEPQRPSVPYNPSFEEAVPSDNENYEDYYFPSLQEIAPSEEEINEGDYLPSMPVTYDSYDNYTSDEEFHPAVELSNEIEPPIEEVRPPTPEVRPPNDDTKEVNLTKAAKKKHKKSRKAKSAAKEAVSMAKELEMSLEEGDLNEFDITEAILRIQTKRIVKLSERHRIIRDLVTQIGEILKNLGNNILMSLSDHDNEGEVNDDDPDSYLDLSF